MILPDAELELPRLDAQRPASTPEAEVWQLLCARSLTELDPSLAGVQARDLAADLHRLPRFRAIGPEAAAYLWFVDETAEPQPPTRPGSVRATGSS